MHRMFDSRVWIPTRDRGNQMPHNSFNSKNDSAIVIYIDRVDRSAIEWKLISSDREYCLISNDVAMTKPSPPGKPMCHFRSGFHAVIYRQLGRLSFFTNKCELVTKLENI